PGANRRGAAPEAHPGARVPLRRYDRPRDALGRAARADRPLVSDSRGMPATRELVLERFREDSRFVLATHEHPDGDALGSLVGLHGLLAALGKDAPMFIAPDDLPLPREYRIFSLEGAIQAPPEDILERTVVFLDCGNIDRNSASILRDGRYLLNLDHHHDNT